ncbi:maltokinase N-terminal cap-like domain-containing protein [Saccharothrix coeruleofusca]|uniref:Maltokinase n=1 Tax=Saccharothrix coeruleofusca TaxID=33919 RepID=A0A918EDS4_9PSEU|nr:aminoglycoside phosphotransferase [Saccharothrix coeruleofusca]MBP2338693.1 maltokinase [Saccharothrix coeruleofusca]GGP46602.1 aminoglycoside phosphotransferase [Saccharothrix coeruleofusca]
MTDAHDLVKKVLAELPAWLPAQRWFGGKDRPVTGVRELTSTVLNAEDPVLVHLVVEVEQQDRRAPYQLLATDQVEHCDATADLELNGRLLDLVARDARIGDLRFEREPGVEIPTGLRGRPVTSEQSNTSLVYGSQYILKLFRKLTPGPNPDLVLQRALQEVGCEHIARPLGSITGVLDGRETTVAMLQQFVPDAVDGWAMATTSVRDLMAEGDLHAYEVGGDFAGEARRLGQAVATVHANLADALGSQRADADDIERSVRAMGERLDRVVASVPELEPYVPALREAFEQARDTPGGVVIQHIHGDLHLGQVLRTVHGWLLIDFEGEPGAPISERTALRSPLRDVAGMLRSFDYAAHQLLVGQPEDHQLAVRALEWSRRNRAAFTEGYAEAAAESVGDPRQRGYLLRAFELDKAVYEVAYEYANRPEWLTVPLSSIARITGEGA